MNEDNSLIAVTDQIKTSDRFNYEMDQEVKKLLKSSYGRVKLLLHENEHLLRKLANELVQKETLTAEQVKTLLGKK